MNKVNQFRKVSHVIFDLDGVLLDTETLYTKATQNIVGKYGKIYNWSLKSQLMGLTGTEVAEKIVEVLNLPITAEEYFKLAQDEYANIMPEAQFMPDTEIIYRNAITNIAKRFGKKYTPEIQAKVIGTPERESSRIAVTEMKLPMSVDDFQIEFRDTAHQHFTYVPLMTGAEQLVKHLKKHNIPLAVATSSSQSSFDLKTAKHKDFFKLFNHIVCGGSDPEVQKGKPSPDIFLICASRFADKPPPEKCLIFEDAPNGVAAALAAGMQVIMIPDENVPVEMQTQAHVKINSLAEAPLEKFGLPALKT